MNDSNLDKFFALSVTLAGFQKIDLQGTGVGETYYNTVNTIVGEAIFQSLLDTFWDIHEKYGDQPDELNEQVRREIIADPKFGPVARNIIKMWYLANWYQLPESWRETYGTSPDDFTHVVSSAAYKEGLVWPAMGAHPMGAKQPGFGTWSFPPTDG